MGTILSIEGDTKFQTVILTPTIYRNQLLLYVICFLLCCRWNATFHDYSSHLAQDLDYSMCAMCMILTFNV